jgi:hypothetical protein
MIVRGVLLLALSVSSVIAGDYVWRLSQRQAIEIATRSLAPAGYDAHRYHVSVAKHSADSHEWLVGFDPPYPAAIHSDILVIVDDATRKTHVIDPGKF